MGTHARNTAFYAVILSFFPSFLLINLCVCVCVFFPSPLQNNVLFFAQHAEMLMLSTPEVEMAVKDGERVRTHAFYARPSTPP